MDWKIWTNEEVCGLYNDSLINNLIKSRRLVAKISGKLGQEQNI